VEKYPNLCGEIRLPKTPRTFSLSGQQATPWRPQFFYTAEARLALGPTQTPTQWALALSPGGWATGAWCWPIVAK